MKNEKIMQNKKNAYLPTLPLMESVIGTTPIFLFGPMYFEEGENLSHLHLQYMFFLSMTDIHQA
jgi:hypothetical protein